MLRSFDGGGHGDYVIGACAMAWEEESKTSFVCVEVTDAFGVVWDVFVLK